MLLVLIMMKKNWKKLNNNNNNNNEKINMNEIHLDFWLDKDGNFQRNVNFLIFGYGRRDCIGKDIAMKQIIIILSVLFLKYKFVSNPLIPIEMECSLFFQPKSNIPVSIEFR